MTLVPISRSELTRQPWQRELARAFRSPEALLDYLGVDAGRFAAGFAARELFAMRVPRPFAARMVKGDPDDPLLRQVLPLAEEFAEVPGFTGDPLAEQATPGSGRPGLLQKYRSRVLMILRGGCGIHCRYCFRRHFPYDDHRLDSRAVAAIVDDLRRRPEVDEVILSGGDPLLAKDDDLRAVIAALRGIPQLRRLRIHTRLPITLPSRITGEFIDLLATAPWPAIVVFHCNHPHELDAEVAAALAPLRAAGITLLNQSVLLRGINDRVDVLGDLSEALFAAGILPYYLHLLDRVAGAAHFEVARGEAQDLVAGLYRRLPGFLVPRLVREVAGEPSKVPIDLGLEP